MQQEGYEQATALMVHLKAAKAISHGHAERHWRLYLDSSAQCIVATVVWGGEERLGKFSRISFTSTETVVADTWLMVDAFSKGKLEEKPT